MPPYGEVDWATPGSNTASVTESAGVTSSVTSNTYNNQDQSREVQKGKCYIVLLSLLNMLMAAMMGALGVLSMIELILASRFTNLSAIFLSGYMVIFATLLFLYELIWWQPIAAINITFRKNFGFLYGLRGKGFYLVFIAFLTLGLINDDSTTIYGLDWITGIGWLFSGLLHLGVACWIPGSNNLYKPPSAGLSSLGAGGTDSTNPV